MLAHELKIYISENNLISKILESLDCHSIKEYTQEVRAGLPSGSNKTAIAVKKDTLGMSVYTNEETYHGDIYTLVMKLKDLSFIGSVKYIHSVLGLAFSNEYKKEVEKNDPLKVFKRIKNKSNTENELKHYDASILKKYINAPNIWFINEGITPKTQTKFNIGFCPEQNRVTIPHRFWMGDNDDYIGVMGRTILPDYDILDIPKYYPLKPFPKSLNLYGLQENYKLIQEKGVVCILESEKATLQMDSWGYNFAVSLGGHEISKEQQKILLGLDVEVCVCFDTDIKEEFILNTCNRFKMFRKVSYIYDKYGVLGEKMSPTDKGKKKFDYLFKYRTAL